MSLDPAGVVLPLIVVAIVLVATYPLACWVSGADEVIRRCEEMKEWAEEQMERGERMNMMAWEAEEKGYTCNDCYLSMQNCHDRSICCEDETGLCDWFETVEGESE